MHERRKQKTNMKRKHKKIYYDLPFEWIVSLDECESPPIKFDKKIEMSYVSKREKKIFKKVKKKREEA